MDEALTERRSTSKPRPRRLDGIGVTLRLLAPVALVAVVLGSACGRPPPTPAGSSGPPATGDPAPDFTLAAADGSRVTLEEVTAGRPALFYFSMGPG